MALDRFKNAGVARLRGVEDLAQEWTALSDEIIEAESGFDALALLMRYLLHVSEHATHEGVARVLRSTLGPKADELMMTVGQQLIEQGRQQGIEQGERMVLLRQLERRFGALPEGVVARVNGAGIDALERWTEQILVADDLDDVFV